MAGAVEQARDLLLALAVPLAQKVRRFGGDEIRLALACRGLGEQSLARPRRAIEQEALGWPNAETAEGLGVLQRKLDALAQESLRLIETPDVVPADRRRLDHHFAHRRGLHALQRIFEIARLNRERVEDLGRDRLFCEVDARHDPPHRFERGLAGQCRNVRADEAVGAAREIIQIDVGRERHSAGVNAEDLAPSGLVGHPDDDLAVEATGAAERLIKRFRAICRGDDDRILPRLHAVQQGQ